MCLINFPSIDLSMNQLIDESTNRCGPTSIHLPCFENNVIQQTETCVALAAWQCLAQTAENQLAGTHLGSDGKHVDTSIYWLVHKVERWFTAIMIQSGYSQDEGVFSTWRWRQYSVCGGGLLCTRRGGVVGHEIWIKRRGDWIGKRCLSLTQHV